MAAAGVVGWRLVFMKRTYFMSLVAAGLLLGGGALALGAASRSDAAPKPACLTRAAEDIELEMAQIHEPWRYLYVPGTNPSEPLKGSATLRATALGLARDLASDEIVAADITIDYLKARAIACGYPEAIAVGGRGVATGTKDPATALVLMTSEQWGSAAGIRVPAWVEGLPMKCIGIGHASEGAGDGWVIVIMAGEAATCPQTLSSDAQPYDGGSPTPTDTPPFVRTATTTKTPTKTPTATPTPELHRLYMPVAKDSD